MGYKLILVLLVSIIFHPPFVQAQSKPEVERKREKFDPSLKPTKLKPQKEQKPNESVDVGEDDDVVRVDTLLVLSDIQVLDKQGRAVAGLNRSDFIVKDDGAPQEITTFARGDDPDRPRSIILIVDNSYTQRPYIDTSVEAAKILIDKLGQKDKMAIVTDDVSLLVDFTQDKKRLKENLQSLKGAARNKEFGGSKPFSALMATLKELVDKNERTLIIFQTDGDELRALLPLGFRYRPEKKDEALEFSVADVYREAENSRTTIYPAIPGLRLAGLPPAEQVAQAKMDISNRINTGAESKAFFKSFSSKETTDERFLQYAQGPLQLQLALESLSRITSGDAFYLQEPKEAPEIYSRILTDINNRYVIGYQPTNIARDGKRRKVNIEVREHPEYVIKGRKSYYAPLAER